MIVVVDVVVVFVAFYYWTVIQDLFFPILRSFSSFTHSLCGWYRVDEWVYFNFCTSVRVSMCVLRENNENNEKQKKKFCCVFNLHFCMCLLVCFSCRFTYLCCYCYCCFIRIFICKYTHTYTQILQQIQQGTQTFIFSFNKY